MWYFQSRLGTFWILPPDTKKGAYTLGCDDDNLGTYNALDEVIERVKEHNIGHIEWDMASHIRTPRSLADWTEGEPDNWQKFF